MSPLRFNVNDPVSFNGAGGELDPALWLSVEDVGTQDPSFPELRRAILPTVQLACAPTCGKSWKSLLTFLLSLCRCYLGHSIEHLYVAACVTGKSTMAA